MRTSSIRCLTFLTLLAGMTFVPDDALVWAAERAEMRPALRLKVRVEPAPDSATLARWLKQNSLRVQAQRMARVRAMGLGPSDVTGQGAATPARAGDGIPQGQRAVQAEQTAERLRLRARAQERARLGKTAGQPGEPGASPTEPGAKGPGAREGSQAGPGSGTANGPGDGPGNGLGAGAGAAQAGAGAKGSAAQTAQKQQPVKTGGAAPRPDPMASLKDMLKAGRSGAVSPAEQALRKRLRQAKRRKEQLKGGAGGSGSGRPGSQGPQRGGGGR